MSSDGMFLGSEVIIISVDDARKLVMNLLGSDRAKTEELQRLGILDILLDLRYAIKRHISSVSEVYDD